MIAGRRLAREIENHFYGHAAERAEIEEREAEIAEPCTQQIIETGIRGTGKADPTLQKAVLIEEALWELKGWSDVVRSCFVRFAGTPQGEFMAMVYTEGQGIARVCSNLYLDRSTYFRWREKILDWALIKAVEMGLVKMHNM